jgi:hypothetical protein
LASLEEGGDRDPFPPVAGVERFWPGLREAGWGNAGVETAYAEHQPARAPSRANIPDFGEVAARIAAARGPGELHRLRRAIALAVHPDRVPAESRPDAERMMARVNAAIDAALRAAGA